MERASERERGSCGVEWIEWRKLRKCVCCCLLSTFSARYCCLCGRERERGERNPSYVGGYTTLKCPLARPPRSHVAPHALGWSPGHLSHVDDAKRPVPLHPSLVVAVALVLLFIPSQPDLPRHPAMNNRFLSCCTSSFGSPRRFYTIHSADSRSSDNAL